MTATDKPATGDADESPEDQHKPVPDEDGPHDVPDDKVIEKTLPTTHAPDSDGSSPP